MHEPNAFGQDAEFDLIGHALSALLDAAVDAIIVADRAGRMVRVNPAACRLFGYDPDVMLGQNLSILMPQDKAVQHDGFMRHHLETGENRIIGIGRELEGLRQNGSIFPLHLSIGRAEIDDQPVFVGIMHDLTPAQKAHGARIELKTALAPTVWALNADPTQLQTALLNLAANAQDAMPDGGTLVFETQNVTIDDSYIAQEVDIKTREYLRISVTDTGQGMEPAVARYVFEPFYTTKRVGKGAGLGLSMVYGFVKQSGGHTTLYSEVGQGTTVSLYFPAITEPAASPGLPAPATGNPLPQGAGQVVLVVEDDANVRRLSSARIEDLSAVLQAE